MLRSALRNALLTLLLAGSGSLHAQHVESPLVPRGQLYIRLAPASQLVTGYYGASGEDIPLGSPFFSPELTSEELPELSGLAGRIADLSGAAPSPITVGATRGRFSANEQVLPLRLDFGILDRLTLGVTVPFVRKRVSTLLRYSAEGSEVGRNPAFGDPTAVNTFLNEARASLDQLRAAVDAGCAGSGEGDPSCQAGRTLVSSSDGFLSTLEDTFANDPAFPLAGSHVGSQIASRWSTLRNGMEGWGAAAPEDLPLATQALGEADFRTLVGDAWPEDGFPFTTPESFLRPGDIEIHLSLGLFERGPAPTRPGLPPPPERTRVQSAIQGTLRLPTGQVDSLRLIAATHPARGTGGVEFRWITDLRFPQGFGLLAVVEGGVSQAREGVFLAPDPSAPFTAGRTRTTAEWTPGRHLLIALTPRVNLGPALSIGAGWHFLNRAPDEFTRVGESGIVITNATEGNTTHSLALELRYAGMSDLQVRRPFELYLRGSRTLTGSGTYAAKEEKVEAGFRLLMRR